MSSKMVWSSFKSASVGLWESPFALWTGQYDQCQSGREEFTVQTGKKGKVSEEKVKAMDWLRRRNDRERLARVSGRLY